MLTVYIVCFFVLLIVGTCQHQKLHKERRRLEWQVKCLTGRLASAQRAAYSAQTSSEEADERAEEAEMRAEAAEDMAEAGAQVIRDLRMARHFLKSKQITEARERLEYAITHLERAREEWEAA